MSIADLRREYQGRPLDERGAPADPHDLFRVWLDEAIAAEAKDPTAMTLATADAEGRPSARTVLLKAMDGRGFVFFNGTTSRKSRELAANPRAALLFYWPELARQVRVRGSARRVPDEEADAYFRTRPRPSRLGAWASRQSSVIESRAALEAAFRAMEERFGPEGDVPLPPHWGGWVVEPAEFEFWQGRPSRLHDRILYTRGEGGAWEIRRLAP